MDEPSDPPPIADTAAPPRDATPTSSRTEGVSDAVLLERAAGGDRDAFAALYDRHVRAVFWQARSVVRDPDLAEDVCQEAFVVAWRRVRSIRVVDASALPWLLVTARQCGLNAARRAARRRAESLDDTVVASTAAGDDVEASVEAELARVEIDAAVAALTETDQRLYALCIDGDHSYEQAAAELGVSHAVVRNRLHRLRQRLRADLRATREIS